MSEILFRGITVGELLEQFGQLIELKISGLHSTTKQPQQTDLITRKETSKLLKVSLPTLHEWTKLGWLQSYKIGTKVYYKRIEVEDALHKVGKLKFKKGGVSHGA